MKEQTLIILKPDALQRNVLGEIINRFENKGLKIVGLKMANLSDELLEEHYAHHKDKPFFPRLRDFMKSSPVVLMVLEGIGAVEVVRKMAGATKGSEALPGTIRGDFAMGMRNIIHASDSQENAKQEIERFFSKDEIFEYHKVMDDIVYEDDEK